MAHIFLSYSRRDAAYVDDLAAYLKRCGVRIWVDRQGIAGGDQWRREIVDAIQRAATLALFLSPNSARSDNVRKEVDLAEQARVPILPVVIAPTEIPSSMKYQLAGVQLIELWQDHEQGVRKLVKALDQKGAVARGDAGSAGPRPPPPARGASGPDLSQLGGSSFLERFSLGRLFGWKR